MFAYAHGDFQKAFFHWDAMWYQFVVDEGYDKSMPIYAPLSPECDISQRTCMRSFAFFPLFPLLTKAITYFGISSLYAGFIVSNLAHLGILLLLYKLATTYWQGKFNAYWPVLLMLFFPTAYVFGAYMTESLFLFLLLAGYLLAWKKQWVYAGLIGMLLSATRNTGVLFALSYVLLWLEQNHYQYKLILKDKKFLIGLLLIPVGLLAFMVFLYFYLGDPLAFWKIQAYWGKGLSPFGPIGDMIFALYDWHRETNPYNHLYNLSYLILTLGLFFINLKKKYFPMSMNVILLWLLVPLTSGTTTCFPRYASVLFPIYLYIPYLLRNHKRLFYLVLAISLIIAFAFGLFYTLRLTITT